MSNIMLFNIVWFVLFGGAGVMVLACLLAPSKPSILPEQAIRPKR